MNPDTIVRHVSSAFARGAGRRSELQRCTETAQLTRAAAR